MVEDGQDDFDLSAWIEGAKQRNEFVRRLNEDGIDAYFDICARHADKIARWGASLPHELLVQRFTEAWVAWQVTKRNERLLRETFGVMGAMPDLEEELVRRVQHSVDSRKKGAKARHTNDPKTEAMAEIRRVWDRQHRPGRNFAKDMATRYQAMGIDISEGGIKNAVTRWRKES